jgi:hypothetical protein
MKWIPPRKTTVWMRRYTRLNGVAREDSTHERTTPTVEPTHPSYNSGTVPSSRNDHCHMGITPFQGTAHTQHE